MSSNLTKWNPFRELEDMQNRLNPWFGRIGLRGFGDETMTSSAWAPLVDITEDDKELVAPGLAINYDVTDPCSRDSQRALDPD
jgi:hypothetical protein